MNFVLYMYNTIQITDTNHYYSFNLSNPKELIKSIYGPIAILDSSIYKVRSRILSLSVHVF